MLATQKSVGRHSTGQNEEVLIVLEGKGEMLFSGRPLVAGAGQSRVYCPPRTVHDVKNTGTALNCAMFTCLCRKTVGCKSGAYDFVIFMPHTSFIFVLLMQQSSS